MDESKKLQDDEIETMMRMFELADKEGLLYEVTASFKEAIRSGNSIGEACSYALLEWDI